MATGDDLMRGLWVLDHLGNSDHCLLEFTIQRKVSKACSKAAALDFKRADFNEDPGTKSIEKARGSGKAQQPLLHQAAGHPSCQSILPRRCEEPAPPGFQRGLEGEREPEECKQRQVSSPPMEQEV